MLKDSFLKMFTLTVQSIILKDQFTLESSRETSQGTTNNQPQNLNEELRSNKLLERAIIYTNKSEKSKEKKLDLEQF